MCNNKTATDLRSVALSRCASSHETYVPLWCKSNYSFLEGASHPEELVEACRKQGLTSMALTDRNGVYGIVRAHVRARELGIHLIVGSQVSLQGGSEILLLAQNREGYSQLCRLLTAGPLRASKSKCRVSWEEICRHNTGLIALWIGGTGSTLSREPEPIPIRTYPTWAIVLYAISLLMLFWSTASRLPTIIEAIAKNQMICCH